MDTEIKIDEQEKDSNRKGLIVTAVFILLLLGSVATTYYRIFVRHDYLISAEVDCDPIAENCYIWKCDPAVDGEGVCTGNPEDDIWYFKNIQRKADNIPDCDPKDESCTALTCPEGEKDCQITNCDPETEECMTPERYLEENPDALLEEESACEEGDEECLSAEEESVCEEGDESCQSEEEATENDTEDSETNPTPPEVQLVQ